MSAPTLAVDATDPGGRRWYRAGGLSAIVLAIAYLVIMVLYVPMGAPPSGPEARLAYIGAHTAAWWAILALSVLTDFLFIPVALALYLALKELGRAAMLLAVAFIGLFVVLDLAITWPNYAVLIALSGSYATATAEVQRAAAVAAAIYPAAVLDSSLLGVYIILVPGIGILIASLVMLRGLFNKATAYVGVATGILAVVSVAGPFFVSALGMTAILASVFTTVWLLLGGARLVRLSQ